MDGIGLRTIIIILTLIPIPIAVVTVPWREDIAYYWARMKESSIWRAIRSRFSSSDMKQAQPEFSVELQKSLLDENQASPEQSGDF